MLDITQLNDSLSMQALTETTKSWPQAGVPSPAESCLPFAAANPRPVVTWCVTRSCNLKGLRSVYDGRARRDESELSTAEGRTLIEDLAGFGVSRLVFAGGEPLMRADLMEWVAYASERGMQPALLTSGTLLNRALAARLKHAGMHSVGILMEGMGRTANRHQGVRGALNAAWVAYSNCAAEGLAAEIRIPLDRSIYPGLADILDSIERLRIGKMVFTHLVYTGPGNNPQDDLTHEEKRRALDLILERARDFHHRGVKINLATDENHVDGIYHYLRLARANSSRAAAACRLLPGFGSGVQGAGVGLAGIDSVGDVHPDPYWTHYTLGNVRETAFSAIWEKSSDPLLRGLRNRLPLLKGRCANCRWIEACGGNLRVRAEKCFGDPWMSDPACYLTNLEIAKETPDQVEAMEDDVLLTRQAA